jgi:DNA-directed RNA polymerase subunit RPC12/RpoP
LNTDYWKKIKEPINVTLDEAHSILNARRSMSKINIIVSDWLALIRRVLGSSEAGFGELTFISQLVNRIDIIARDMATNVIYTICHYIKTCEQCGATWKENSEMPEGYIVCPLCNDHKIFKHSHKLEVWHFPNIQLFQTWHQFGQNTFYKHYIVNDIENYFQNYNTLQWDNMFGSMY